MMKKIIGIGILCGLAFYAGTHFEDIVFKYKMNRLQNELQDVYSRSRHLERAGRYIVIPEAEWEKLHEERVIIIKKMKELKK